MRSVEQIRPTIKWSAERQYEGDRDFNDFTSTLKNPSENSSRPNPLEELAAMIESGESQGRVPIPDIMTKFIVFHRTDPSSNVKVLMRKKFKFMSLVITINLHFLN